MTDFAVSNADLYPIRASCFVSGAVLLLTGVSALVTVDVSSSLQDESRINVSAGIIDSLIIMLLS